MKEGSEKGALKLERGEGRGRGAPVLGTLKDTQTKALETGIYLQTGPIGNMGRTFVYRRLWQSKRALGKRSVSVYGNSVNETWRKGFCTGNTESYVRHVKEGSVHGTSVSV
jgi:hypothetical protein